MFGSNVSILPRTTVPGVQALVLYARFVQKSDCDFPAQNYFFFQTFQGILFIFM